MRDRQGDLEELTGRVSHGLLAGDVVVAVDHLLETGDWHGEGDRETAARVQKLLEALSERQAAPARLPRSRQMLASKTFLETMHAVQAQAPNEPVQEYLQRLAVALRDGLDGQLTPETRRDLGRVRDLFAYLGQRNLARVNDVTRSRRDLSRSRSKANLAF
jgi:hypothetical protein